MNKGRVFACADLHGRLDLYQKIKEFLQPEDTVYFLGDACDRGSWSWETVKAIAQDPQFIYLFGNHEDMMVNSLAPLYLDSDHYDHEAYYMWMNNGGGITEQQISEDINPGVLIRHIAKRPIMKTYQNKNGKIIYLSHAGFTPAAKMPSKRDMIWDRYHIMEGWPEEYDDVIVVHGHTPIPLMARYEPWGFIDKEDEYAIYSGNKNAKVKGAVWYADGHKVNIDCGAVWTGKTVLLDLDTFEQHIFEIKGDNNG